jgi:hypothetical protein
MPLQISKDLNKTFTKQRYLWQPGSLRILREASWAAYARDAVPPVVNGLNIQFPETVTRFGLKITTTSSWIDGLSLQSLLEDPDYQPSTVPIGMTVLNALHQANLYRLPSRRFSWAFRYFKGLRLVAQTFFNSTELSASEKAELRRLVRGYILGLPQTWVLAHGDLHASHVLVDLEQSMLGVIDLEAMHVGKAATNFAQLWDGYYYADPELGRLLFAQYFAEYADEIDDQFDNDVRLEIALRSHRHVHLGRLQNHQELLEKGSHLLHLVLCGASFRSIFSD